MGYTNSPLVAFTKLSPNHSGKRTHRIDRISPHCTVGNITAEGLGEWFYKPSTRASSNYGIGRDGRIGLYVEEGNRSWCSSSAENDQRAVTIECASDEKAPFAFKDIVYQRLIELCVDICRRNGKKKLLWLVDKNLTLCYEPKDDEMVITVHRWFANKSCPGDWLYERLGEVAKKVTAALENESEAAAEAKGTVSEVISDTVADSEKHIWDFLMGKIGNAFGAAGLMGNLYAESGLRPDNLQNSYEKSLNMSDKEYTVLVDGGTYQNFVRDKAGYGLAQWTFWSRKQALWEYSREQKKSIGDLQMQLDFLWKELNGSYHTVVSELRNAKSVRAASDAVLLKFERPADQSEGMQVRRAGYGQRYYEEYADDVDEKPVIPESKGMTDADCPFRVRVSIPDLNIRVGAGTDAAKTGKCIVPGVYTIVEVRDGKGSDVGRGRLKSGAGWINMNYCERINKA